MGYDIDRIEPPRKKKKYKAYKKGFERRRVNVVKLK